MRIDEMVKTPVLDLRRDYDSVGTARSEIININGNKYLCIVYKRKDNTFGWYYHDCDEPYNSYEHATGFKTEDEAYEVMMYDELGLPTPEQLRPTTSKFPLDKTTDEMKKFMETTEFEDARPLIKNGTKYNTLDLFNECCMGKKIYYWEPGRLYIADLTKGETNTKENPCFYVNNAVERDPLLTREEIDYRLKDGTYSGKRISKKEAEDILNKWFGW
jgi:hypothetical protein